MELELQGGRQGELLGLWGRWHSYNHMYLMAPLAAPPCDRVRCMGAMACLTVAACTSRARSSGQGWFDCSLSRHAQRFRAWGCFLAYLGAAGLGAKKPKKPPPCLGASCTQRGKPA